MANKKRRNSGKKKRKGGSQRPAGQRTERPKAAERVERTERDEPLERVERTEKPAGPQPGGGRPGAKNPARTDAERKLSGSARRAAQKRAAKRKRQMLTFGIPTAVVVLIVVVVLALGGTPISGGKVAPPGSITVDGASRDSTIPVGEPVPSFSAPGLSGGTVSWSKGTPTVLTMWAVWCSHCQVELPKLNEMQSSYPGVEVTSVNTAQGKQTAPFSPQQFVTKEKITFPVAIDDASQTLAHAMGVQGFPLIYLINADGTVYKIFEGEPADAELAAGFQYLQDQGDQTPSSSGANSQTGP